MGLFRKNKLKIEKMLKNGIYQYFIDYSKQKESDLFLTQFYQSVIEGDNCLIIIDSDLFYEKRKGEMEGVFSHIKSELDQNDILFQEFITMKDADQRILGMKMNTTEQINHYRIGMFCNSNTIKVVLSYITQYNIFCYILKDNSEEELMNLFQEIRGSLEEFNQLSDRYVYHDSYFKRIGLYCRQDILSKLEMIVQRCETK